MGREVRKVPPNWEHPRDLYSDAEYDSLFEGKYYTEDANKFIEALKAHGVTVDGLQATIEEYGTPPNKHDFMPDWPDSKKTHYMMYRTSGEPISPIFDKKEDLAHWLDDNKASFLGPVTKDFNEWLEIINREDK